MPLASSSSSSSAPSADVPAPSSVTSPVATTNNCTSHVKPSDAPSRTEVGDDSRAEEGDSDSAQDEPNIYGPFPDIYIPAHVWDKFYDSTTYIDEPVPSTPQRQAYEKWVRDHAPFVVIPKDYCPPKPTPLGYSVYYNGCPLLHWGVAFTWEEVGDYAKKHFGWSDEQWRERHAVYAAHAMAGDLSRKVGMRIEVEFPLSLQYHYILAICNTNNKYTKSVKPERVKAFMKLIKREEYGKDRRLLWWWDREWTHPRNGHDPSWVYSRKFTGDAEGPEYDRRDKDALDEGARSKDSEASGVEDSQGADQCAT